MCNVWLLWNPSTCYGVWRNFLLFLPIFLCHATLAGYSERVEQPGGKRARAPHVGWNGSFSLGVCVCLCGAKDRQLEHLLPRAKLFFLSCRTCKWAELPVILSFAHRAWEYFVFEFSSVFFVLLLSSPLMLLLYFYAPACTRRWKGSALCDDVQSSRHAQRSTVGPRRTRTNATASAARTSRASEKTARKLK